MKYIILSVILLISFTSKGQYYQNHWNRTYTGWDEIKKFNEINNQYWLDLLSFDEMRDSTTKYIDLYNCSKNCNNYDSIHHYYSKAVFFLNQSEYYCALLYGADSVRSKLYLKPGEKQEESKCKCN